MVARERTGNITRILMVALHKLVAQKLEADPDLLDVAHENLRR